MGILQTILLMNTNRDCLIAAAIIVGSCVFAISLHTLLHGKFCTSLVTRQNLLSKNHIQRISLYLALFFFVVGFSLSYDHLYLPADFQNVLDASAPTTAQILLLLILDVLLVRIITTWLTNEHEQNNAQQDKIQTRINRLIFYMRLHLFFIVTFLLVINFGVFFFVIWKIILSAIGISFLICMVLILQIKGFFSRRQGGAHSKPGRELGKISGIDEEDVQLQLSIVELFLKIYAFHQLGVQSTSSTKYICIEEKRNKGEFIFELCVLSGGAWRSRRMTIGRLGLDVTSRSKCFYVIYDSYLVIKIPPEPITDIKKYIKILRRESRIAGKLKMKECIIPELSVILEYVHPSFKKESSMQEEVETRYLKPLSILSNLHSFLKIDGSFVFFMDLSKYYFLQDAYDKIHDTKELTYQEIVMDSRAIISSYANDRQKARSEFYKNNIARIFSQYQSAISTVSFPKNTTDNPSSPWITKAFFMRLAGHNVADSFGNAPQPLAEEINHLIDNIIAEHESVISRYQKAVKDSAYETTFKQNKTYMEGIVSNLLDLLARLEKREVAIRDLKPDNLLVAGDRNRYPDFLAHPESYRIGLIDVETAVILNKQNEHSVAQPQLGGTDQYATPSHFLNNSTLTELFGGISKTIHLQDWYAIIAICYKVILGSFLFEKTAAFVPIVIKEINSSLIASGQVSTTAKEMSILFWRQAAEEFAEKMVKNEFILDEIEIEVTQDAREMIHTFLLQEFIETGNNMKELIASRNLFSSTMNSDYFLSLSNEQIANLLYKWEKEEVAIPTPRKERDETIETLQEFLELKTIFEKHKDILELLEQPSIKISSFTLLDSMFGFVYRNMINKKWKIQELCISKFGKNEAVTQQSKTHKATEALPYQ